DIPSAPPGVTPSGPSTDGTPTAPADGSDDLARDPASFDDDSAPSTVAFGDDRAPAPAASSGNGDTPADSGTSLDDLTAPAPAPEVTVPDLGTQQPDGPDSGS